MAQLNKKMKALFVITGLRAGGAERVFVNIVNNISGFEPVVVVIEKKEKDGFAEHIKRDIKIRFLNKRNRYDAFRLIFELSRIIRNEKPGIILSVESYANQLAVMAKYIARYRVPLCISERIETKNFLSDMNLKKIREFLLKLTYRRADRIIAVSKKVKESLYSHYGINPNKIEVIYNPIDIDRIQHLASEDITYPWFNDEEPVLITVGRLHKQKDHKTLISAFSKVLKMTHNVRLVIIGEGSERARLEKIIQELNLNDRIVLLGYQENPYKFMAKADIFILSSRYEGFPNVILEAMACGLPVISTDCPSGPGEIITHGVNGLLVPVGDADKLAEAMLKLLDDKELRERLSLQGQSRVKDFEVGKIINQYERVLHNILEFNHA